MIVKKLKELLGTDREVDVENWTSRRFLLKGDGMGFSMHDTLIKAGTETFIWYANHLEAVYCIEGCGEVEVVDTGELFPIEAGTLYALDGHEKHYLRAHTQMRMVCVFNPPLTGKEVHDAEGIYPLVKDEEPARAVGAAD
jgi:L-ectoine synthase